MNIDTTERNGTQVVHVEGLLDTHSAPDFEAEMNRLIEDGARRVEIDFSKIDFVTSTGLRVLLAAAKRLNRLGGGLTVSGLNKTVQEVFDIAGLGSLLALYGYKR